MCVCHKACHQRMPMGRAGTEINKHMFWGGIKPTLLLFQYAKSFEQVSQ